jgi:hypothetical protein
VLMAGKSRGMQRFFAWVIFLLGIGALFIASQGQPGAAGYAFSSAVFAQETRQTGDRAAADGPLYRDVTEAAGINARHGGIWRDYATEPYENAYLAAGSAWADYDNDGWMDLFMAGNLEPNVLYRNKGDGTFETAPQSETLSLPDVLGGGGAWADYDNDGWRDLYVVNAGANRLYRNIQGERFEDVTEAAGVGDTGKGTTAAWGDYDADGYVDLYVANWSCHPECDPIDLTLSRDVLYRNNGDGTFTDISHLFDVDRLQGSGFSVAFFDYDNDSDPDIYVLNDKVSNAIGNVLWRNDGAGCEGWCWTDVSAETGADMVVYGMGLATADYDNDGDLDLHFTNMVQPMVLLGNQGDGTFEDTTAAAGVGYDTGLTVGWGTGFLDYDNDGRLDLYQAMTGLSPEYGKPGMMFAFEDRLYRNEGDGRLVPVNFLDADEAVKRPTVGFSAADYDNDGWIDFLVGNWNQGYRLYHNEGAGGEENHWLTVDLEGGGFINRDAIGARVYVVTGDGQMQMREVRSGSSIGTSHDLRAHFGLGDAVIDHVRVVWPGGGPVQVHTDVESNQILSIEPFWEWVQ